MTERSKEIQKLRRKIEDKLRKELTDDEIISLANLLGLNKTKRLAKDKAQ